MNACTFLSCVLVVLLERIFSRCEGINSSTTAFSSGLTITTSFPSSTSHHARSTPWCLNCTDNVKLSMASTAVSASNERSIQPDRTKSMAPLVTITAAVSPTRKLIDTKTQLPAAQRPLPQLTSFGIFLITFGGVLVAFMIISLIWICCGGERSPEVPHPPVKLKPWSHPPDHSDMATETSDIPNSFQNQGLNSSSPNNPSTPNSNAERTTENISSALKESPLI
ncbi:hypothetical protein OS493_023551 [Desmophyllum pertusum]|uniref:Uncharacterized protein n=1 Tax=Desmophyllum pertusum TaxID=174260 RepID=A0A9W9ZC64_9CNID|nr:hypothetical protein OS493_023551 [Desmophyllum pertusum]